VARDAHLEHFRRLGVPAVSIGRPPGRRPGVPFVDLRSGPTVTLLLEHLWGQGASRIGLVVGAERRTSHVEGEAAYRAFAAERGMPPVAALVDEASGEAGGRSAVHELLRQHPQLDGLCVPVDVLAVGALAALEDAQRRVPDDVVVATRYDGIRARTATPALTAVDLHLEDVGRAAIDLLFEHLTGDAERTSVTAPLPALVVRASSLRRGAA
jgi:DNA-binding LacI/PurR family transcriptional regulator